MNCDLCYETADLTVRGGQVLCEDCAEHWDYYASLSPEDMRAEEEMMALHYEYQEDI